MQILHIAGSTRVLAKDQEEYMQLPIRDSCIRAANGTMLNFMSSAWEPSPKEAALIAAGWLVTLTIVTVNGNVECSWNLSPENRTLIASGGSLVLSITGVVHPPVSLGVSEPDPSVGVNPVLISGVIAVISAQKAPELESL